MAREIKERLAGNQILQLPVAAGVKLAKGDMVVLNAAGYAQKAAKETGLVAAGAAAEYVDNTSGDNGDVHVCVERGVFVLGNAGDIKETDVLKECSFASADTVTLDAASAEASSKAGRVFAVYGSTVAVEIR